MTREVEALQRPQAVSTALLDANVLFPGVLRDLLLHLASVGLYAPRWSPKIHDEWIHAVMRRQSGTDEQAFRQLANEMDEAFPDASHIATAHGVPSITLPDRGDRHVVSAALIGRAEMIVTFNLKDFPRRQLKELGLRSIHPDHFARLLFERNEVGFLQAIERHRAQSPDARWSEQDYGLALRRTGMSQTAKKLRHRWTRP